MIDSVSSIATIDSPNTYGDQTSGAGTQTTSSAGVSGMNGLLAPNEFLSLLVDNLKYQDPLDPTSSADLLTQLASLSQVQTQQQIAETDQTSAAANLIGDTVTGSNSAGDPITGVVTGFSLTSQGPSLDIGKDSVSLGDVSAVASAPAAGSDAASGVASASGSSASSSSSSPAGGSTGSDTGADGSGSAKPASS
jgi:flagellar basal-body rod modification protein FlgD